MEAILIIVPRAHKVPPLLTAIAEAGAPGATVIDAQGQEFLTWIGTHPALGRGWELGAIDRDAGKAVLAIVPDVIVDAVVAAAERVLDNFDQPYAGMLCTWHIGRFRCFQGDKPKLAQAALAAELREGARS